MRARLAALAAVVGSFFAALPAQAQDAAAAAAPAGGSYENVIPIWVWVWILVVGVLVTVGFAACGSLIGNSKR